MSLDPLKFKPMIKQIARSVSAQFPASVSADDTEQALYIWLLENKASVSNAVADGPDWEPKIASTMRKVAFSHCAQEKASIEGYSVDDIYKYSVPKVRNLLEDVFSYESWQTFGLTGDGQPTAKGLANRTGDRIAELVDVKIAVESMPDDTYNLLVWQYKYHYSMEQLAEAFDLTLEAVKKRSQRAVKALQKRLGHKAPAETPKPVGRRTVRTNAAARYALSTQYEG